MIVLMLSFSARTTLVTAIIDSHHFHRKVNVSMMCCVSMLKVVCSPEKQTEKHCEFHSSNTRSDFSKQSPSRADILLCSFRLWNESKVMKVVPMLTFFTEYSLYMV